MLRSVLVVLGSFIAMALVVVMTTALSARLLLGRGAPGARPRLTPAYLGVTLCFAALMVVMSLASMRQSIAAGQPRWYALVLLLLMPLVALLGGLLAMPST